MEILGWIVAGSVILGFLAAGLLILSYRLAGPVLRAPRGIAASIRSVREVATPDKSWPEYMLTLHYSVGGKNFRRRVVVQQADFERLFPGLKAGSALDGTATVPLLVDFHRGSQSMLDPRWLTASR